MISNDRYRNGSFKYIYRYNRRNTRNACIVESVKRQSWLSVVNYLRIEGKRAAYTKYSITDPHEIDNVRDIIAVTFAIIAITNSLTGIFNIMYRSS